MKPTEKKMKQPSILPYTLAHLVTAASSGYILSFMLTQNAVTEDDYPLLCLLFATTALALPILFGWIADRVRSGGRIFAVCGLCTVAIGMFVGASNPVLTAIIIGVGSACANLGGGIGVLMGSRGFCRPAVYLSVAGVGYALGEKFGEKEFFFSPYHFVFILLFVAGAVWCFCGSSRSDISIPNDENEGKKFHLGTILKSKVPTIVLLVSSSLLLTFASSSANRPESESSLAFLLPSVAVFGGIALGGFLSDLIGARKVGAFALLVASPLLVLGAESFLCYLAGIMLLSTSASIILVLFARCLPSRTGLATGLLSLAASVGVVLAHFLSLTGNAALIAVAVISMASAVMLFVTANDTHPKRN